MYCIVLYCIVFYWIVTISSQCSQIQEQLKVQEISDAEKLALKVEVNVMKEKLSMKETEVQREIKRRQKTHIELMDVR